MDMLQIIIYCTSDCGCNYSWTTQPRVLKIGGFQTFQCKLQRRIMSEFTMENNDFDE